MQKRIVKETTFAGKKLVLETGVLAVQANMAVKATYGDTVLLITAVSGDANPDLDFFPLTVVYEEKLYASGTIKSSRFVKRDGRPTDAAVIKKRLIDHAIRPLFPEDFMDDVQVVVTVLSLDEDADVEFLNMIGVSACLTASNIPWEGLVTSAKIGYADGKFLLNPSRKTLLEESSLDMIISFVGEDRKYLACEAEAHILPEKTIIEAMNFAQESTKDLVGFIKDFAKEVNPENNKYVYESKALDPEMLTAVKDFAIEKVMAMLDEEFDKTKAKEYQQNILDEMFANFEGVYKKVDMVRAFSEIEKHALQKMILEDHKRPDGRQVTEVRPISVEIDVLPRPHGSALFTRGLTQALTVVTLGSPSLEMLVQDMYGERAQRYMHFYDFPPYSVGETGRFGGAGSREIGHGMLAEKALYPVLPDQKEFPYTIVLTSETLSSSGSSSMASTCGSTLALMAAGVPIKDMVAGIGVGLISNDDFSDYVVMTDLAYMEDAFGFLDFKMTGTEEGVTAIQSDMKLKGIPMDLMATIIEQSREGRLHVLEKMQEVISKPKEEVSVYAPKTKSTQIDPEKIGMVIGSGGSTIREIQDRFGVDINIEEDGTVTVSATDLNAVSEAITTIENMTKEVEVGEIYEGKVVDIANFGAFVEILPGKDGLVHISELQDGYVDNVTDVVKEGDIVKVKVTKVEPNGKIGLSIKALSGDKKEDK